MPPIEPAEFRKVLGTFPTGVCVISGHVEGRPVGITIGSFTSISLDPPLVGFFIDRASTRWPGIAAGGAFCVNVLGSGQADACYHFTRQRDEEFGGFATHPDGLSLPVIRDAVAWITCEIDGTHPLGDHDLIVGRVVALRQANDASPLVFCQGALGAVQKLAEAA